MKKIFAFSVLVLSIISIPALPVPAETEKTESTSGTWRKYYFELSFGNSVLFLDQSITESSGNVNKQTLPVPSFLFLGQLRAAKHFALAAVWNLPYTTVKCMDESSISEKFVAPTYGAGIIIIPSTFSIRDKTYIEPELALLTLRTYKST